MWTETAETFYIHAQEGKPLAYGLRFAFANSENLLGAFRLLPRESLSILGNLPSAKFFHTTLRLDPQFVPDSNNCGDIVYILFPVQNKKLYLGVVG